MDAIAQYLQAKSLSRVCQRQYQRSLEDLARSTNGSGLLGASHEEVLAWFSNLRVGDTTKRRQLSEICSFFKYAVARGWLKSESDPTAGITAPRRVTNQVATFLTTREARLLMDAPDRRTPRGRRDAAIMALLNHGLRLAEVTGLDTDDLRNGRLKVRGKGRKERLLALSGEAKALLRKYRKGLPLWQQELPAMFPGEISERIGSATIQRMVTRYGAKVGVASDKCHPHSFRHGCATRLLFEAEADLETVRMALGHSNIQTTSRYLHLDCRRLEQALARDPLWRRQKGKVIDLRQPLSSSQMERGLARK